ncbi:MAG: DUF885 family protein, partial [Paucibacter sp.]|nr:DUF885 family protein [Roseateles sp.]
MFEPAAHTAVPTPSPTQRLHALFEACWERELAENPLQASYIGDPRFNALWPDLSEEAQARSEAANRAALAELDAIEAAGLPEGERLNAELFRHELRARLDVLPFHPLAWAISAREGPQALNEVAELMPLDTVADFEVWLQRLGGLPDYLQQYGELLERAAASGRTQPRLLMERVLPQLDGQCVSEPELSPFFSAFRQLPARIAPEEAGALQAEARRVIA